MKILQICSRVPYPPDDGGAIATLSMTKNLIKEGCHLQVLAINTPKHFQPDDALKGIAELTTVYVNTNISFWGLFAGLFGKVPYNIKRFISLDFKKKLIEVLKNNSFDIIQFEGLFVAWYIQTARENSDALLSYRAHNVEHLIWKRLAQKCRNPIKKWYLKKLGDDVMNFEKEYLNLFDIIIAISDKDKERMIQQLKCKKKIEVIPTGIEFDEIQLNKTTHHESKKIGFLGSLNWEPNLEGLEWFLNSVWNKIIKIIPTAEFHVAGKGMQDDLKNLQITNAFFHGYVEDSATFLNSCSIIIVPLLSGSGIRVKVIEGMAYGKCIVSTRVGTEGIPVTDGNNIVLADRAEIMINKISHLFSHPEEIERIGSNAREFIRINYDNKVFIRKLIEIYKENLKK
ncbi:MAG: hypothetical protein A3H98_07700 [Bacteroidetes bacterium RIFCSPLOWO2_02_FULL_36_8]|nr:MAG: hypothetical protein A3H98_07700 [Bacteroidetes bacterium RIFCSPLOWO2_02_FULL_36_8]OFY69301.1 MAG: hypothetical protein A3G23_02440 [Bacteroidetes bacterium RIFCSPLOWO2_12_FULL_37_12]